MDDLAVIGRYHFKLLGDVKGENMVSVGSISKSKINAINQLHKDNFRLCLTYQILLVGEPSSTPVQKVGECNQNPREPLAIRSSLLS
jgi:hypothetical protein